MNSALDTGKNRQRTRIAVYLIGLRGDQVLLGKRQNTGHMDGHWSLVAGHVQEGEACTQAMLREIEEECGLLLQPHDLQLIGAMHHLSSPFDYTNFIFKADLSQHNPINREPNKCEQLAFFPITALPSPMAPYIITILKNSFSEEKWIIEVNS